MRIHLYMALILLGLALLGGCATKSAPDSLASRFPDQPPARLALTPEQGVAGKFDKLPVSVHGGWGYTRDDAFTLTAASGRRKNNYVTVPLESRLVRARNEAEFSDTPPKGQRYLVVDYGTISRTLGMYQGRMFAVWKGRVSLLSERVWPELYQQSAQRPPARRATAEFMAKARSVSREYWFDITDTFSRNGVPGLAVGGAVQSDRQERPAAPGVKDRPLQSGRQDEPVARDWPVYWNPHLP